MFCEDHFGQRIAGKTDRLHESELTAALHHIATHDNRQADRAQQNPETAERGKYREVGVLHGIEFI